MPNPTRRPENDPNAPPLPETNQRDEQAIAPTERREHTEDRELAKKIHGLAPGRMVRAVVRGAYNPGQPPVIRPAIVVDVTQLENGVCNLQIFTDGENDRPLLRGQSANLVWGVSYQYSETRDPGSWHWPDRI